MKIYLVLASALTLVGTGLFLMEWGRPPSPRCSERGIVGEQLEYCLKQQSEVDHLTAVLREMREKNARIAACDHRSWFGLVGKNECQP